jgi:hypothetical protein
MESEPPTRSIRAALDPAALRDALTLRRPVFSLEQILDMVAAIAKIPGETSYREPIQQAALDSFQSIKDA